ncbi:MAG TPA: GerMN domain-containing protein [Spirochaetia bacterium]|nr:GerMN domain-containing protein [Spirochaetia bacterium]
MAAKKTSRTRSSSLKNRGLGCLFWLCLIAIIVAVGYAARAQLADTFNRLVGTGAKPGSGTQAPQVTIQPLPHGSAEPAREKGGAQGASPEVGNSSTKPSLNTSERIVTTTRPPVPQSEGPALRKTRLFFLSVDPNGSISMKGVIRPIPQSESPLRDALVTLLKGPTSQEINLGLLTMIPSGTTLRGVTVRGDTAYVDFSESFRFNSLGIDGMKAQLRQVVYAATEFPTVKKVQFLIEGKRVDYLGTEGVSIKDPLSRSSF